MTTPRSWVWFYTICVTPPVQARGHPGLSAEQVLRAAILKNWHQLPDTKLAFLLSDSQSFRRFARLPWQWTPSASCLQDNISRIQAGTWQQINRLLVQWAEGQGLERGRKIRADATAVESPIPYEQVDATHQLSDGGLFGQLRPNSMNKRAKLVC